MGAIGGDQVEERINVHENVLVPTYSKCTKIRSHYL